MIWAQKRNEAKWPWWTPVAATLGGWMAVFATVGTNRDLSTVDYVRRAVSLPDLFQGDDPASDYRNWSILPLAVGRVFRATTPASFAALQAAVLVAGTAAIIGVISRRRGPRTAMLATAALFSTTVAGHTLHFAGSYDQLLVVLLLAAALVKPTGLAIAVGVGVGLTHAEVGLVVACALGACALAGLGPPLRSRLALLGGVVAARVALTLWFAVAGETNDRIGFVRDKGVRGTIGDLVDTWPTVLWSCLKGGWLIVAMFLLSDRPRRQRLVGAAWIAGTFLLVAFTVDQTRVAGLVTLPLVILVAADGSRPAEDRYTYLAAVIGLAAPLTVSLAGGMHVFNTPFAINW